jgi:hypothetical protein
MPKYIVPINFWGTIEAKDADEAWGKVYKGLSDTCGAFENAMVALGMEKTEHTHEEVDELGE